MRRKQNNTNLCEVKKYLFNRDASIKRDIYLTVSNIRDYLI